MQELRTKDYLAQKFRPLRRLAGNTPLLGIHFRFHSQGTKKGRFSGETRLRKPRAATRGFRLQRWVPRLGIRF